MTNYAFWIPVSISIIALFWNYFQHRSIEKLKQENEKARLIHRVQFEKEFEIYSDLWSKLVDLKQQTIALRPHLDYVDPKKTEEEISQERLKRLNESYMACVFSFEKNKPFYAEKVYNKVKEAIQLSFKESIEYNSGDKRSREYWKNAEENIQEFIKIMDSTCDLIRQRIGLLEVNK